MKNYFVAIAAMAFIGACSSSASSDKKEAAPAVAATPAANDITSNPDYEKGLTLIAKSDCLTCHKTDSKLIGPPYKDVAAKYESNEANVKLLASKVIKGGSGVWGQIPMTPHPTVSEADAEQMVKYVLLLRK